MHTEASNYRQLAIARTTGNVQEELGRSLHGPGFFFPLTEISQPFRRLIRSNLCFYKVHLPTI